MRFHRQRARNGHALLLATAELPRVLRGVVLQTHTFEQAQRGGLRFRKRLAAHTHRGQADVVQHRLVREQVELLEHHADTFAHTGKALFFAQFPVRLAGQLAAIDDDAAFLESLQAVHAADQRGLARPAGADDDQNLALGDVQVHALQYADRAEGLVDATQLNDGGHGGFLLESSLIAGQR